MITVLETLKDKDCQHTSRLHEVVRADIPSDRPLDPLYAVPGGFMVLVVTSIPPGDPLSDEQVSELSNLDRAKLRKHVKEMTLYAIRLQHGTYAR